MGTPFVDDNGLMTNLGEGSGLRVLAAVLCVLRGFRDARGAGST